MDAEEKIMAMFEKLSAIEAKLDNALTQMNDHEKRIRELEKKPAKRWEMAMGEVLQLLVAAVVGYVVAHLK